MESGNCKPKSTLSSAHCQQKSTIRIFIIPDSDDEIRKPQHEIRKPHFNDEIRKPHYMLNPNVKLIKPASFECDIIIIILGGNRPDKATT